MECTEHSPKSPPRKNSQDSNSSINSGEVFFTTHTTDIVFVCTTNMATITTPPKSMDTPNEMVQGLLVALTHPTIIDTFRIMVKDAMSEILGEKLNKLEDSVTNMKADNDTQKINLNKLVAQVSHQQTELARQAALNTQLAARLATLETKIADQSTEIVNQAACSKQQTVITQSGKVNNVVISGIAETTDEDVAQITQTLADKVSVKLGAFTAKRIGKVVPDKTRPILVVLNTCWDKRKLYATRTMLKDNGYPNTYINEDLTTTQGELFFHARKAKVQGCVKSTWTENGVVFLKLNHAEQATVVSSINRLKELIPNYHI